MKCSKKDIVLHFINVQRQAGKADCGVFSIAFAYSLCCGVDPHKMPINQSLSHLHLLSCFLKRKFSAFPHVLKSIVHEKECGVKRKSNSFAHVACLTVRVMLHLGLMAQCSKCKGWFYQLCEHIPSSVINSVNATWFKIVHSLFL